MNSVDNTKSILKPYKTPSKNKTEEKSINIINEINDECYHNEDTPTHFNQLSKNNYKKNLIKYMAKNKFIRSITKAQPITKIDSDPLINQSLPVNCKQGMDTNCYMSLQEELQNISRSNQSSICKNYKKSTELKNIETNSIEDIRSINSNSKIKSYLMMASESFMPQVSAKKLKHRFAISNPKERRRITTIRKDMNSVLNVYKNNQEEDKELDELEYMKKQREIMDRKINKLNDIINNGNSTTLRKKLKKNLVQNRYCGLYNDKYLNDNRFSIKRVFDPLIYK